MMAPLSNCHLPKPEPIRPPVAADMAALASAARVPAAAAPQGSLQRRAYLCVSVAYDDAHPQALVAEDTVTAVCRGSGELYDCGHDPGQGWWCSCPARTDRCAHLDALRRVVVRPAALRLTSARRSA